MQTDIKGEAEEELYEGNWKGSVSEKLSWSPHMIDTWTVASLEHPSGLTGGH